MKTVFTWMLVTRFLPQGSSGAGATRKCAVGDSTGLMNFMNSALFHPPQKEPV